MRRPILLLLLWVFLVATLLCGTSGASAADEDGPGKQRWSISEVRTSLDSCVRASVSPDGKLVAVIGKIGSGDRMQTAVVVIDISSGRTVKTLAVQGAVLQSGDVAFSPDGNYLVGGSGTLVLWSTKDWAPVRSFAGPYARGRFNAGGVTHIAFSPSSDQLAVLYEGVVYPKSASIETIQQQFEIGRSYRKEQASRATFIDRLEHDQIVRPRQAIFDFDVETGQPLSETPLGDATAKDRSSRWTSNIVFDNSGALVVARSTFDPPEHRQGGSWGAQMFLEYIDARTGTPRSMLSTFHAPSITAIGLSKDGKLLATGGRTTDKVTTISEGRALPTLENTDPIALWNRESGHVLEKIGPPHGTVRSLAFDDAGDTLVSCQTDIKDKEIVWVWQVDDRTLQKIAVPGDGHRFVGCAVGGSGRVIAIPGSESGRLTLLTRP